MALGPTETVCLERIRVKFSRSHAPYARTVFEGKTTGNVSKISTNGTYGLKLNGPNKLALTSIGFPALFFVFFLKNNCVHKSDRRNVNGVGVVPRVRDKETISIDKTFFFFIMSLVETNS